MYNDIRENTDIEYILDGNNIKENIIVKAKSDSYEYAFKLSLTGLTAELDQGGNVLLRDEKDKNIKYTIPAPYMYDGNGEYSYDAYYTLIASKDGYTLKVIASDTWINDESRAFPVTIDPTIQGTIWVDTYIDSQNPNFSYAQDEDLYVSDTQTVLIKPYMPNLPLNISSIDSAELYVTYYYVVNDFMVGAYGVTGMITETTTYNNSPSISATQISGAILKHLPGVYHYALIDTSFDITQLFRNWYYNGEIAYGIAIKQYMSSGNMAKIKSSESDRAPYLRVKYSQQVPDGVYAIKNVEGQSYLIDESCVGAVGEDIQHMEMASPTATFFSPSLFKISGANGLYIIRLMTNNNLTLAISNGQVITKEIASKDEDVPNEDKFSITLRNSGYIIAPYNSSNVIAIAEGNNNLLTTVSMSASANDSMRWTFEQYTGAHRTTVFLRYLETWDTTGIVKGESEVVTLRGASTYINEHTFDIEVTQGFEDLIEVDWNTLENTGTITAKELGQVFLGVNLLRNSGDIDYLGSYIFVIIPIEGTYYIQNVDTGRYVEVAGPSTSQRVIIQQGQFTTDDYSKWIVEHVEGEGGYVRLKSPYSNLYISITSHNEYTVRQFAANDYNLWLLQTTGEGTVKIINKATADTNLVLAVPLNENSNGTDLTQIEYTNNDNNRDEWRLTKFLVGLYGIESQGHDHVSGLQPAYNTMNEKELYEATLTSGEIDSETCKNVLQSVNLFTSRSHGTVEPPSGTDVISTGIVLSDTSGAVFYSHAFDGMSANSTNIMANEDYSNILIAMFIGCFTGAGGENGNNLVSAIVEHGARAAVGFESSIRCDHANEWTLKLYEELLKGETLQDAVDKACNEFDSDSPMHRVVICGDSSVRIVEQ